MSTDHYKRYLGDGPMQRKLVVEFVNFLKAGLIFQAEDQNDGIHPACKLRDEKEDKQKSVYWKMFALLQQVRSVCSIPEAREAPSLL